MCVILHLEPNSSIDEGKLTNAVYNNPHGWGIIVLSDEYQDGMYVEHCVPESGETNPKDIVELLEKYKDKERILHLRWATVGEVTLENAHPFKVYDDIHTHKDGEKRHIAWFMHNGTLYDYGSESTKWYGCYDHMSHDWVDGDVSDSRDFATSVLQPYLDQWDGHYNDHYFKKLVEKFWTPSSRGIIISNYGEVWRFGSKWETLDVNMVVGNVKASNDTYFDRVTRGPEFERRQEERKKQIMSVAEGKDKGKSSFLSVVPWDTLENPPINFDRLSSIFRDIPIEVAPEEVFHIIRAITNDEVAHLLVAEVADMKEGAWEPETSLTFNLLLCYVHYFELAIKEVENQTGKKFEEIIPDASEDAA